MARFLMHATRTWVGLEVKFYFLKIPECVCSASIKNGASPFISRFYIIMKRMMCISSIGSHVKLDGELGRPPPWKLVLSIRLDEVCNEDDNWPRKPQGSFECPLFFLKSLTPMNIRVSRSRWKCPVNACPRVFPFSDECYAWMPIFVKFGSLYRSPSSGSKNFDAILWSKMFLLPEIKNTPIGTDSSRGFQISSKKRASFDPIFGPKTVKNWQNLWFSRILTTFWPKRGSNDVRFFKDKI